MGKNGWRTSVLFRLAPWPYLGVCLRAESVYSALYAIQYTHIMDMGKPCKSLWGSQTTVISIQKEALCQGPSPTLCKKHQLFSYTHTSIDTNDCMAFIRPAGMHCPPNLSSWITCRDTYRISSFRHTCSNRRAPLLLRHCDVSRHCFGMSKTWAIMCEISVRRRKCMR